MINRVLKTLIILAFLLPTICGAVEMSEVEDFLDQDNTDEHNYTNLYNCGHFSRSLAHNASEYGIKISSVMLTYNDQPIIKGYGNHIINYFEINGTIYFIEPQNDRLMTADDLYNEGFNYGRLYEDGTMVPTSFKGRLTVNYNIEEHINETLPITVDTGVRGLNLTATTGLSGMDDTGRPLSILIGLLTCLCEDISK